MKTKRLGTLLLIGGTMLSSGLLLNDRVSANSYGIVDNTVTTVASDAQATVDSLKAKGATALAGYTFKSIQKTSNSKVVVLKYLSSDNKAKFIYATTDNQSHQATFRDGNGTWKDTTFVVDATGTPDTIAQDSTVIKRVVHMQDMLGTKLTDDMTVVAKPGTSWKFATDDELVNKYDVQTPGANDKFNDPTLKFTTNNEKATLQFAPAKDAEEPLTQIKNAKYTAGAFQQMHASTWEGYLRVITSDDGIHWKTVITNYPPVNFRDTTMVQKGDTYWLLGTDVLYSTKDFKTWTKEDDPLVTLHTSKGYGDVWAPDFFRDADGKVKIVYSVGGITAGTHQLMLADFDETTGKISNMEQPIKGDPQKDINLIDGNIHYSNGYYYLYGSAQHDGANPADTNYGKRTNVLTLYKSKTLDGDFEKVDVTNEYEDKMSHYEAPEAFPEAGLLYSDPYGSGSNYTEEDDTHRGIMYMPMDKDTFKGTGTWQKVTAEFKVRHFSPMLTDPTLEPTVPVDPSDPDGSGDTDNTGDNTGTGDTDNTGDNTDNTGDNTGTGDTDNKGDNTDNKGDNTGSGDTDNKGDTSDQGSTSGSDNKDGSGSDTKGDDTDKGKGTTKDKNTTKDKGTTKAKGTTKTNGNPTSRGASKVANNTKASGTANQPGTASESKGTDELPATGNNTSDAGVLLSFIGASLMGLVLFSKRIFEHK